jgi:hypothetical protein
MKAITGNESRRIYQCLVPFNKINAAIKGNDAIIKESEAGKKYQARTADSTAPMPEPARLAK